MVPVSVVRAACWLARGLGLLTGLAALALALSAGHLAALSAMLSAPAAVVTAASADSSGPAVGQSRGVHAAKPAGADQAEARPAGGDRAEARPVGGEPTRSGGATYVVRGGGRWTAALALRGERGVGDITRSAVESAPAGPVAPRAPPRG